MKVAFNKMSHLPASRKGRNRTPKEVPTDELLQEKHRAYTAAKKSR